MPEIYLQIAERDFFEIFVRNMKEHLGLEVPLQGKSKRKRKPEEIEEIVYASIEIVEQFMEFEPLHFRNYCVN
jgi:hypothetical protein